MENSSVGIQNANVTRVILEIITVRKFLEQQLIECASSVTVAKDANVILGCIN